jgi:hypothetical protein
MSMKRTKQRGTGTGRSSTQDDEDAAWSKPAEPEPKWTEVDSKPDASFLPFAMSSKYSKGDLILHSKFGKGLVLGVEPGRIEVLFHDGKKKLGHAVA